MVQQLRGENQITKFKMVANEIISKVAAKGDVAGILLLGGLARNFVDEFSDLDVVICLHRKDKDLAKRIRNIGSKVRGSSGIDVDLEIYPLDALREEKWDEMERWDFSNSKIAFDPDGEIDMLLREKLRTTRHFWMKRIVIYAEHLRWYCCPNEDEAGSIAEAWIARGDRASAHYCLNHGVDLLLRLIFALNRVYLPPPKWRLFYSYGLRWLPNNYVKLIRESVRLNEFSSNDLNRRLKAIRKLWSEVARKAEVDFGLTADDISRRYVNDVLHQA